MDQLSTHTWLPCLPQLFTDVLATTPRPLLPRGPGQQLHHARLDQSSPAPRLVFSRWRSSSAAPLTRRFATASRPATHPPRRLCRCRHCAPASSVLPATSQLPRRPGQHLPDGAPPRRTASSASATVPRPAAPPPLRPGQQQTSPGGEKYSGLASNLAHLGRIC